MGKSVLGRLGLWGDVEWISKCEIAVERLTVELFRLF